MKITMGKAALIALAVGLAAAAATASAHRAAGCGAGMMSGQGMVGGSGMMGAGPGMMGAGPGMMGEGRGHGPGMMERGGAHMGSLNLSDEQRDRIQSIHEDNLQKNWTTMGQVRTEMFKLRRMASADNVDANAIVEQQKKVDELRQQMFKSRLEARNQVEGVLTPEQRKQFRHYRRWQDSEE